MRPLAVCGGLLSLTSLLLLAIGMATDHWVDFTLGKSSTLNPTIVNNDLAVALLKTQTQSSARQAAVAPDRTRTIEYNVKHFGLWIGCFIERSTSKEACAYVRSKCNANVCWIRQTSDDRAETCQVSPVDALQNCTAYLFVRAFIVMAIIVMVLGTSTQLVSLLTYNRTLAAIAGVMVFVSGVFVLLGFSIFYGEEYAKGDIKDTASVGFSFILIVVSWPLMLLGGILSCYAASAGIRKRQKFDYSQSNF